MDDSQPEDNSNNGASAEYMTNPATEFEPAPIPSPSLEPQLHLPEWSHSQRIFLDLCSGAGYPLSKATLQHQCMCFPVDILIDDSMDLLNNAFFEPLLRICSSGLIAYGAGAPNCGEYSRLKLRPGGPPALRTPENLSGVPNLSAESLEKVQQSFEIMVRIVLCLELIFSSGGHVHLEQPTNSMAWLEPEVRRFIKFCSPHLVHLPACKFGANWRKGWIFACSYRALISMSGICNHPPGTHEEIAGVRWLVQESSNIGIPRTIVRYICNNRLSIMSIHCSCSHVRNSNESHPHENFARPSGQLRRWWWIALSTRLEPTFSGGD